VCCTARTASLRRHNSCPSEQKSIAARRSCHSPGGGAARRHFIMHTLPTRLRVHAAATLLIAFVAAPAGAQDRPKVGVAFGGGSARGIAHVGVIRWFEEHHVPIDVAAGTSMGGLIGGSFATGMDAAEIQAMLRDINWDEMFGFSDFAFKNIRRKTDALAYPSHLEFGLKNGISGPSGLNDGQQVDLLITRITAPYYSAATFDVLPTPFRMVAVDLKTATPVVLDRGSLAGAMRATMSLPGVFPPVEMDGKVLVDGGAMNNIPADVVRAMGGQVVIAVNVGELGDQEEIKYSIFSLMGSTLDAMMRANTKRGISAADIVLNVPVVSYGSLAWRRGDELIEEGYKATEAMKDRLLPYALADAEWQAWVARRTAARKTTLPPPAFVLLDGVKSGDERRMSEVFNAHVGKPLDVAVLEHELEELSGLDRYETIRWQLSVNAAGETGLTIRATEKQNAPPFLMLGVNLENTTSDQFQLSLAARYLRFDVLGSGSELRLDASVGSDASLGAALYYPVWRQAFVIPSAGISNRTYNLIRQDEVVARYGYTASGGGLDVGVNLGRDSDVRAGASIGRVNADVIVGDPGLAAAKGKETKTHVSWRMNTQDRIVQPTHGVAAQASFAYTVDGPGITTTGDVDTARSSVKLPQLFGEANVFKPIGGKNRLFLLGGGGTSFSHRPLPLDQFLLGTPLHLGAYSVGEVRGDHYWIGTVGVVREIGRMPDFLGGPVHAGVWLENGDAFNAWSDLSWRTHVSTGLVVDTLIGPMLLGGSVGFDGRWRTYVGIGRLIR
jgi:NTE family protein